VGAIHAAHDARTPVILDGLAVGVAALAAVRLRPTCREWLVAATAPPSPPTRSCSPSSGSSRCSTCACVWARPAAPALALALIEQAGRLHREMATFAEAGVDGP
jgi:nicotinate-nucleotide--dimethylbenzimidazole phosphoribosyltransferase